MTDIPGPERVEAIPDSLWERIRAQPERSPEYIALSAAERFAPAAARWVALHGSGSAPSELARNARRRHVRLSRLEGAALGLGGAVTAAADLVALAWIQSRMVFFIAAASGYDPADPMRPAELLVIQGIYPDPPTARAALDGAGTPLALQFVQSKRRNDEQLAARMIKLVGRKVAKRAVLRAVPILSSPISAVANARATGHLGDRALAYYGAPATLPAALPA